MDGHEADFARLVSLASTELRRAAWLLTGDWAAADDLVQTTLLKVWQHWSVVRRRDEPVGYARRVMMRIYLGWRSRRWVGELSLGWLPEVIEPGDLASAVAERHAIAGALHSLPKQQRAVLVLRYFSDLSEQETARAMGCSVGSVKTHAFRGLAALRSNPTLMATMSAKDM